MTITWRTRSNSAFASLNVGHNLRDLWISNVAHLRYERIAPHRYAARSRAMAKITEDKVEGVAANPHQSREETHSVKALLSGCIELIDTLVFITTKVFGACFEQLTQSDL